MRAWDEDLALQDLLSADPEVELPSALLDQCFSTDHFLRHAAVVFDRLEQIR
jgi:hypothetical protein